MLKLYLAKPVCLDFLVNLAYSSDPCPPALLYTRLFDPILLEARERRSTGARFVISTQVNHRPSEAAHSIPF